MTIPKLGVPNQNIQYMKTYLLLSFMFTICSLYSNNDSERDLITQIDSINTQAQFHYNNHDLLNSFRKLNQSIKLADSLDDGYGNAKANFTLGKIYMQIKKYDNAKASFLKTLKLANQIEDNYLIASSYLYLGELSGLNDEFQNAVSFYEKAYSHALNIEVNDIDNKHSLLFKINMNLSHLYLVNNKLDDATFSLLTAKDNLDKLPSNYYNESEFNYYYGSIYLKKRLYNLANDKFNLAINAIDNNTENKVVNLLLISNICRDYSVSLEKSGENDLAYAMFMRYYRTKEKYNSQERIIQEHIVESKLHIELYKQEVKLANEGIILQEKITEEAKSFNTYITITALLVSISFISLLIIYLSKRRLGKILKSQNKELETAKELAEESSRLKTKFVSNVSHELRTPLYGVVGLTSLMLKNNDLSTKDAKYLKSLKYSGDYLLNLINDILQVGKIESNKLELNNVSVKIKPLIQNIIDSFEYRLEESNNKIHLSIDERLPEFVVCDKVRLTQVLFNLIGNSIKFTENGNIYVRAILLDTINENANIRFEIEDDGMGIPKDKQTMIFENFSQLSENINMNQQGTGLGLTITKKLIELFNSNIELESELGKGSVFSFNLSLEIDYKAIEEIKIKTSNSVFTESKTKNLRILIAEDNKINQIVTSNLLKKENYQCDIAQNGLEAVNAFKMNNYDLILMDINMPVMDGNEATLEIKKLNSEIPIVALTASNIDDIKEKCDTIGFDDIITKPFDNELFFKTISNLIKLKQTKKKEVKVLELAS